jgi:hypothetical protein
MPLGSLRSKTDWGREALDVTLLITWKYSSVDTPNHSGESRNWWGNTMWSARPFCDTTSLLFIKQKQKKEQNESTVQLTQNMQHRDANFF